MIAIDSILQWRELRKNIDPTKTVGVVTTMGNLHQGHASLIKYSKQQNDITIVTLFVNPTQFNNPNDFNRYPHTLAQDFKLLEELQVDYCLHPDAAQMYADDFIYKVSETKLSELMEGHFRPGHFTGVLTVVLKLLLLTKPHRVYFGEKDYQQLQLVHGMVNAFFLDCEIIPCPTIRESSNLALSSRNNRLTPEQYQLAQHFAKIFHDRASDCEHITQQLESLGIKVDYITDFHSRRFAAVYIDEVRLIDNYSLPTT